MPQRTGQRTLPFSHVNTVSASPATLGAIGTGPEDDAVADMGSLKNLDGRSIYVIDAHSLIYQVFHALPEMTSGRGEPVAAVYGFTRDLFSLIEEKKPDGLLCAFDRPGPTFRHEIYDQYKANRDEMPDELSSQLPKIRTVVEALGIPILELEGFEADDILATVARQCEALGGNCYLVTGDKDCRQLLSDRVAIYNVRKDEVYGVERLAEDWGIRPDQVVDFQSLVGDPTDNVPGIPLIGPKLARQLLEQYDSLEGVLEHAHEVKGAKRRQNLMEGGDIVHMSGQLVRLDAQLPIQIDWLGSRVDGFDCGKLTELFAEYGFRSFGERLDRLVPGFQQAEWRTRYQTVDTPEQLSAFLDALGQQSRVSLDTETTSLRAREARIIGYSFSWVEGEAYYLPVNGPLGDACLDPAATLESLRPVLEDPAVEKVGQNLKYDMIVLRNAGVRLSGVSFDTMVASYLLDAGERNHNLDDLSKRYLRHTPIKISELIGTGKHQKGMEEVPVAEVGRYAAEDADIPLRLQPILASQLEDAELQSLFRSVEIPLVEVLADMEFCGIRADVDRLAALSRQYGERMAELEAAVYEMAGHPFNIASPKQLASVLFQEQGLPVLKKTKTGPSTDAEVLEQLAALHPLPAKIVEYRQYAKLKNTYVDALPAMVHPETGRVHASFHQVVAATGRLSSSDPNLQNIPVRTETGREIRSAFTPDPPDWKLLTADYSQIELRVLAHFSADPELCQAFEEGQDIHARVAGEVFQVPQAKVTPEMRRRAKAVNFGVIYGQSPFGLAKALGIERDEAAQFIDSYFNRYPGVEQFLTKTLEICREKGYVKTILGRRRAIRGVRQGVGRNLNLPERTAVNTVIQGSAADLIKLAMIAIHARLRQERLAARMLLQIHDELIFEVPVDELVTLGELVESEMCHVLELDVPLVVDLKAGDNWAECEPWHV